MSADDLNHLLQLKSWRAEFTISDTTLRIFLQDPETGDCGVLAVEPVQLALPDERALEYSWQDISAELGPPPDECLIADLKTNTEPDFQAGDTPFLF